MADNIPDNPRLITFAEAEQRYGGGGVKVASFDATVSLTDATLLGRTNIIVPFTEGRLIKSVRFVPPMIVEEAGGGYGPVFLTPNTTGGGYGFAYAADLSDFSSNIDTLGLFNSGNATDLTGNTGTNAQICDCGPLYAIADPTNNGGRQIAAWQADTPYCFDDCVIDPNGHIQVTAMVPGGVQTGGVSGSSEPTWNDSGGTTSDGTITWNDAGIPPVGSVHVVVEAYEGISPIPPRPATLEFVAPPIDVVAGATMADITVLVKDQNGDPYTLTALALYLFILGDGTLNGTNIAATQPETGIATFTGMSITDPGTYVLRCLMQPVLIDYLVSDPFDVTAP